MIKKTTTEAVKALALTPKALLLMLVYHPELRPSALGQPLSWGHFRYAQWSDTEIERIRAHRTTYQRRRSRAESTIVQLIERVYPRAPMRKAPRRPSSAGGAVGQVVVTHTARVRGSTNWHEFIRQAFQVWLPQNNI